MTLSKNLYRYVSGLGKKAKEANLDPESYEDDLPLCLDLVEKLDDFYCISQRDTDLAKHLKSIGKDYFLTVYKKLSRAELQDRVWSYLNRKKIDKIDGLITDQMKKKYSPLTSKTQLQNLINASKLERCELLYIFSRLLGDNLSMDKLTGQTSESSRQTEQQTEQQGGAKFQEYELGNDNRYSRVYLQPSHMTSTQVSYQIGGLAGETLKCGENWLFGVPEEYLGSQLQEVLLYHRKPIENSSAMSSVQTDLECNLGYRDCEGAYVRVQAQQLNSGDWVNRNQTGGGMDLMTDRTDLKFAEPRPADDPESETYRGWHVQPSAISLSNVGSGPKALTNVHEVEFQMLPTRPIAGLQEHMFTPHSQFSPVKQGYLDLTKPVQMGGGLKAGLSRQTLQMTGYYPGALKIGDDPNTRTLGTVNSAIRVDSEGRLRVKLRPGKVFGFLEIMAGDRNIDLNQSLNRQKTGDHYGQSAGAWLRARLNTDAPGDYFLRSQMVDNADGAKILSAGPFQSGHVVVPNEEVIVESRGGEPVSIMGLRVWYLK